MAVSGCRILHVGSAPSGFALHCFGKSNKARNCVLVYCAGGTNQVNGENRPKTTEKLMQLVDQNDHALSKRPSKDLSSLPRPLSISDLSTTPKDGSKVRISYKGVPGAYSEDAAPKAYPNCETAPCDEFEYAFKAVELWLVEKAVLPIENTAGGSIHRNYDLLLRHRLHIVGEVQLAVNLCLLSLLGVRTEHLKHVLSHPQALDLSDNILSKLGVARENVDETAGAAQHVASHGLTNSGVIASPRAAEMYGLNVLAENIQTSIVFTLDKGPGMLFKALAVFVLREINLTKYLKQESRPQRNWPLRVVDDSNRGTAKYFDYLFYIDFEASMAEPRAQNALGHLQEFATFLRVLGCYPMDTTL